VERPAFPPRPASRPNLYGKYGKQCKIPYELYGLYYTFSYDLYVYYGNLEYDLYDLYYRFTRENPPKSPASLTVSIRYV
jgi:hypothetical protein